MKTLRQVNIKNCQNYFFNSMTNIKNFDSNLLSIDQMSFKSTDCVIYDIKYFKNLDSSNSLYLVFNDVDVNFKENNENEYLVFALTDKNKEALENYTELWDEMKNEIETIIGIEPIKYEKFFMKIKFESDDGLPVGRILSIPVFAIIFKSVFQENDKYYLQVHLHECFYEHEHESEDDLYSIV